LENVWFDQRLKILDNSLELLKKEEEIDENDNNDDLTCARCRIYQRKKQIDTQLFKKIKHIHQEHNYSRTYIQSFTPGFHLFYIKYISKKKFFSCR